VHELAREYGIGPTRSGMPRRIRPAEPAPDHALDPTAAPGPTQLSLL
jgi:hypothetical protein